MENRALGKGLSALIPDKEILSKAKRMGTETAAAEDLFYVATAKIRKNALQPRTHYHEEEMKELTDSIREKGILQPILIREEGDGYEVIAGERRLRAARTLNLEKIPAIIKKASNQEALVLALVENIQREELNPIEEAEAFQRLITEFHLAQEHVATAVGKNRSTISNTLRLLRLPEEIKKEVIDGKISMGHARALLSIENIQKQREIFEKIVQKELSVREVENLIKRDLEGSVRRKKTKIRTQQQDPHLALLEEELQQSVGTKVRIQARKKRGRIIIEYYSLDDLDRILKIIKINSPHVGGS